MKTEKYTTDQLLKIIKCYYVMTQRSGDEFPAVVIGDIKASTKAVLKANGINEIKYIMNGAYKNDMF